MHNVLQWSYGDTVPGLRFRVDIYPYYTQEEEAKYLSVRLSNVSHLLRRSMHLVFHTFFALALAALRSLTKARWVEPPSLQADLSQLLLNDYTVSVTAVAAGGLESIEAPSDGITFSYNKNTIATYKCESGISSSPPDNK